MHESTQNYLPSLVSVAFRMFLLVGGACVSVSCTSLPAQTPSLTTSAHWDALAKTGVAAGESDFGRNSEADSWWLSLHDHAIDSLVEATLNSSPDLAQAMARIQEAQATLGESRSATLPQVSGNLSSSRGSTQISTASSRTQVGSTGSANVSIGWELDLFGRLRSQREAAQQRLAARTADAQAIRIALEAEVADRTVEWRSCNYISEVQQWEVASRAITLSLVHQKVSFGIAAPIDESRATNDVEYSRASSLAQQELCGRTVNALVALTGLEPDKIRSLLEQPPQRGVRACRIDGLHASSDCDPSDELRTRVVLAAPPQFGLAAPAIVLAENPSVISAQRELAAAHADLDTARASRYPSLNLTSLLSGQWLSIGGQAIDFATWTAGAVLSVPLVDGGSATARIDGAEARYREVQGRMLTVLRSSAQDVENALLASTSADRRAEIAQRAAIAAATSSRIAQIQWQSGASTLLDLEDARRQYATAAQNAIAAAKDRSQSWIALVRATGNHGFTVIDSPTKEPNHVE